VGRTEKHKYDFRDHSRRLQVIFDVHPKKFTGVKLQQSVLITGLDKYIYISTFFNNLILYVTHNFIGLFFKSMTP